MNMVNLTPLASTLALLLCLASGPAAAELYRWTDENGNTHFSSQPPTGGQPDVERLADLPPSRFRPALDNGVIRCGKLAMSWPNGPVDRYVLTLAHMIESQRQAIAQGAGDDIADMRRCLIGWMQGQLDENRGTLLLLRDEYRQAREQMQQLAEDKAGCDHPGEGWLVGEHARQWMDCYHRRDREQSRLMDRVRELQVLQGYWQDQAP